MEISGNGNCPYLLPTQESASLLNKMLKSLFTYMFLDYFKQPTCSASVHRREIYQNVCELISVLYTFGGFETYDDFKECCTMRSDATNCDKKTLKIRSRQMFGNNQPESTKDKNERSTRYNQ